jgi:UDP-GlcNAc:undecaprenyl-phosphate GlcNAc-1-phosphate transferase
MTYFFVFATSAMAALVAGGAVRRAAIRYGAIVPLRADRWHRHPTPTFGGIAIALGILAGIAWRIPVLRDAQYLQINASVLGVAAALFGIGWYDDVRPFSALAKIVNSLAAAAFFVFVVSFPVEVFWNPTRTALSVVAMLWFVLIDNAVNLLDNMDGVAGGTTAIAAVGLAFGFQQELGAGLVSVLIALAGGLLGFLIWNRHPARLFMGNCGSLAIGGLLAACSTVAVMRAGTIEAAAAAALILITPLFDSGFVVLLRRLAGRSPTAGNIDHTSHRLVSAGFSEPLAAWTLYALAAAGAVAGGLLHTRGLGMWPFGVVVAVGALLLGLYLARLPAYDGQDFSALQNAPFAPLLADLTLRWHAGEVLLDLILIPICYYTAYRIRFTEAEILAGFLRGFMASLPLMVGCQIAALYASGVYSRAWSTFGFRDLWSVVRGVGLGSMAAVALIAGFYKQKDFQLFSTTVFAMEAALLMGAIFATRLSFRFFSGVAAMTGVQKRRVMIYGAGVRGQMLVREMLANASWEREPVAYLDDDASKHMRRLLGVPVRGSADKIEAILDQFPVDEVLLSSPSINGTREAHVREVCLARAIPVRRLYLDIR